MQFVYYTRSVIFVNFFFIRLFYSIKNQKKFILFLCRIGFNLIKYFYLTILRLKIISFNFAFFAFSASAPENQKKQTQAGKYLTASEAYEMWKKNPDKVKIIDVRTQQEYSFVGHAPMAFNIPFKFWAEKWNPKKKTIFWNLIPTL